MDPDRNLFRINRFNRIEWMNARLTWRRNNVASGQYRNRTFSAEQTRENELTTNDHLQPSGKDTVNLSDQGRTREGMTEQSGPKK